ncbi:hypothetical protein OIU74_001883 [Salix koriyanagi]|uniref:Uncharacterized protein n=1 Tax=Salix koriyanagi TaxID=2511006 RepID=A0A9Q0X5W7_9ROSI|nr:hypothetical protein OIU74_001883 [Salix koriyanagi]
MEGVVSETDDRSSLTVNLSSPPDAVIRFDWSTISGIALGLLNWVLFLQINTSSKLGAVRFRELLSTSLPSPTMVLLRGSATTFEVSTESSMDL